MSYPWTCQCGRTNAKNADYCGSCASHWSTGTPQYPRQVYGQELWDQWENPNRRQPSPSPKPASQAQWPKPPNSGPPKGQHKGKGKGKNKDKGKSTGKGKGKGKSEPSWKDAQAQSPADASMTSADPQVRQLLKKETDLPPHILTAVQEITKQDSQAANKAMHSAVTKIGAAKKALHQAQEARVTMHAAWRVFLAEATARWYLYGPWMWQRTNAREPVQWW